MVSGPGERGRRPEPAADTNTHADTSGLGPMPSAAWVPPQGAGVMLLPAGRWWDAVRVRGERSPV